MTVKVTVKENENKNENRRKKKRKIIKFFCHVAENGREVCF
jgi:hypothetical protein